jgi:hypothetical protein
MLFLLLILISFNNVLAKDIEVTNKIISIPEINGFYLQGFTTVDDKIVAIFITDDETECIVKIFDINTKREIYNKSQKGVGHANDITYNSKTNNIYVVHGGGTDIVHVFDKDMNYIEDIKVGLPIRSLTYDYDRDIYLARTVASGFIYNNDLTLKSKIPFITAMNFSRDIARQGWEYHNNYLFYTNWSWIRLGGDGSNIIRVYDLDGNRIDVFVTKDNIGELESIAFYDNKMILGFNSYNDTIDFYLEDIPEIKPLVKEEVWEEKPKEKNYNFLYFIVGFILFFILGYIIKKRF